MLKMPICRYEESKVKYRTKILWMSICREGGSKVKETALKYCRWQYADMRKLK